MLLKLSSGLLDSPAVLFIDGANDKGNVLFLSILKSFIKSSPREVHVFCWEANTFTFLSNSGIERDKRHMQLYDCFSDPKGWINKRNQIHSVQDMLKGALGNGDRDISVVLDSLSVMLFTFGFGRSVEDLLYLFGQSSKKNGIIRQVLCMVHSDVLPGGSGTLSLLKHMSNTTVEVKGNEAHTTYRKLGGHVEKKKEHFFVSTQGDLIVEETGENSKLASSEDTASLLPQDVASFRVSLNEKEREDKNRVVLPYMRTSGNSGGKVFYQPDSVDDWDDEDPDDDLDI